jgi:hypothetical protein
MILGMQQERLKTTIFNMLELCSLLQIIINGAHTEIGLRIFACVYVFIPIMIYLVRLWATKYTPLNDTGSSEEWTGKDVEGISHITISNNTSVSTLNARRKGNRHLH